MLISPNKLGRAAGSGEGSVLRARGDARRLEAWEASSPPGTRIPTAALPLAACVGWVRSRLSGRLTLADTVEAAFLPLRLQAVAEINLGEGSDQVMLLEQEAFREAEAGG